jgi:hypothetical protein
MKTGLPPVEAAKWDKQIEALGGGILQSHAWARFQADLGREVVWDEGEDWLWIGAVRRSRGVSYLLCSYGPVAKDQATAVKAAHSIVEAGRALGLDFVRVEPQFNLYAEQLQEQGGRRIHEFNAERTRLLDLTQSEEALRAGLASGHRNLINGTERRGITIKRVKASEGLGLLDAMLTDTAKRAGVSFFDRSYFKQMVESLGDIAKLYLAEAQGKPVAAALVYDWGGTRYYAHAGAFQDLNRQVKASVSLVWLLIINAKQNGAKRFDLWGVSPEGDTDHRLAGVTRFKNAFGGTTVEYAGTWDIPLKPLKYRAYQTYRAIRGMER